MKTKRTVEIDAEDLLKFLKEKLNIQNHQSVKIKVQTSGSHGISESWKELESIKLEYEEGSSSRETWDR
jgi:acetate kinase